MSVFQYLANHYKIPVYLAYTRKMVPTTTFKLYTPNEIPQKYKHNISNMKDYETFLYKMHKKGLIFFARMGKMIVHIDPWMINAEECFDNNGIRNDTISKFPESIYGCCLINAVKSELLRYDIMMSDEDIRSIEKFVITE